MAYASPLKPFNRPFNKATYNVCGLCDKRSCYFVYDVQKTHDCSYCRRCYCVHDAQQTHDCAYCRRCFNYYHDGLNYFDLMLCQFVAIDDTHDIAQTINNNETFHVLLITEDSMLKIMKTVQIIQRAWRKKIANRHFNNIIIPLCLSICKKRRMQYFIDPVSNRMWWWIDDKNGLDMYGSFGWFD